ncbi:hypothetical protein KQI84_05490 [bacterium]|nr:hypothetical protein [bacterium]
MAIRFRSLATLILGGTLLGLPAVSSADLLIDAGQYVEDRVCDFADMFRLRVGVPRHGEGYGVKARATSLAQIGFVHYNGHYFGMERRALGLSEERRTEGGISVFYSSANEMIPNWGNQFLSANTLWSEIENRRIMRNYEYWDDGRGHFLSVGAEVATPILGIDVGVYPSEALDFVTGFVCIDPFNDDQLMLDRNPDFIYTEPTTPPEPDLDAATREEKARVDGYRANWEKAEMEASGQLDESAEPAEIIESAEPMDDEAVEALDADEPMDAEALEELDRAGQEVEYEGSAPPAVDAPAAEE